MNTKTMTMAKWLACLGALGLFASGCPGEEPPSQTDSGQTDSGADAGHGEDAGLDAGDDVDADDGPVCEPITECPADACGAIDDGCEGTLECAECECVGGELTATDTRCGLCGWGLLSCTPGHTGEATCTGPPPEETGFEQTFACDTHVVYLDLEAPEDGRGTANDPHNTYESAWAKAVNVSYAQAGVLAPIPTVIAITTGTIVRDGMLAPRAGISIIGGFERSGDQWTYDTTGKARTRIEVGAARDQGEALGVFAFEIEEHTVLSHLELTVDDAPDGPVGFAGGSSYGLIALDSPGLSLRHMRIRAGAGGVGGTGSNGADGANGEPGEDGVLGTNKDTFTGMSVRPDGGVGGNPTACDPFRGSPRGGDGGRGGGACSANTPVCEHYLPTWTASDPPTRGGRGLGVIGSVGGDPLDMGPNRYTSGAPGRADDGVDGFDAATGVDGEGGVFGGRVEFGRWVPTGYGAPGEYGRNGGGGGGGGATEYTYRNDTVWYYGTGGAGGGSGGCSGDPGLGGGPGGASIGVLLIGSPITLRDVEVVASMAGAGGDGGVGGQGGEGAPGGIGTSMANAYDNFGLGPLLGPIDTHARSGDGGAGGRGATGGKGGGGAGGASYGVYCMGSDGAAFVDVDVEAAQHAASGGQGLGAPGAPGETRTQQGCVGL